MAKLKAAQLVLKNQHYYYYYYYDKTMATNPTRIPNQISHLRNKCMRQRVNQTTARGQRQQ
jgi:hypothetical protein